MNKFKKGDYVKCIYSDDFLCKVNFIYQVVRDSDTTVEVQLTGAYEGIIANYDVDSFVLAKKELK